MFLRVRRALVLRGRAVLRRLGLPIAAAPPAPSTEGPEPLAELGPELACLFDAGYYLEQYPDVADAGVDPVQHYVEHGRAEGRRLSVLFDPAWYVERYADVAEDGGDPLAHFLAYGGAEGRDPVPVGFSSSWYLEQHPEVAEQGTNPLVHFLIEGAALGYDPCPHFEVRWYTEQYPDVVASGLNPLAHFLKHGLDEGRQPNRNGTTLTASAEAPPDAPTAAELRRMRMPALVALRTMPGPARSRINLVTDSIGRDSLFGGVATAIILATLWANQTGRRLRIVTRNSAPDGSGLADLRTALGVAPHIEPELAFIPSESGDLLEVGDEDLFLTTSWWTTSAVLSAVPAARVVYILQEDERQFYPTGTETLLATAMMNHPGIQVVVNTEHLLEHLIATGIPNLSETAIAFEPSFAAFLRPGRLLPTQGPRDLFFYARPNNPRNMFDMGVAVLDGAVEAGFLGGDQWRIHLVGRGVPALTFCDGSRPVLHDGMSWYEYRDLLGGIDLGLSLMASPHPSYPPFDLAAGGSVVVTNTWRGKTSFEDVSDRVLTAEPTVEALVQRMGDAVDMVEKCATSPFEPEAASPYFSPWAQNLKSTVDHLVRRYGDA